MISHINISAATLRSKIRQKEICYGGNVKLKIYGELSCASGKRMKRKNRLFFSSEKEAIVNGYRPCGHCMNQQYKQWKSGFI